MSIRGMDTQITVNRALERMPDQVRQTKAEEQNQAAMARIQQNQTELDKNRPPQPNATEQVSVHINDEGGGNPSAQGRNGGEGQREESENPAKSEENADLYLRPIRNPKNAPPKPRIDISI